MFKNVIKSIKAFKVAHFADKSASATTDDAAARDAEFKPQRISRLIDIIQPTTMSGPTPEEICGVTSKMTPEQTRERLALLYRRFNRAASSLDPKLRH